MAEIVRPTKKQRELLNFISAFIEEHGYSPSYREICSGTGYASVATVAEHIQNLIQRGHLRKRDHSARSLEVVYQQGSATTGTNSDREQDWLIGRVEEFFIRAEQAEVVLVEQLNQLSVLVSTLHILGLEAEHTAFYARLQQLSERSGGA